MLVIKLDELTARQVSWTIIFIPSFLIGFLHLISIIYSIIQFKALEKELAQNSAVPSPEAYKQQRMAKIISSVVVFIFGSIFFYTFIGLLLQRLNNSSGVPSAAVILIPIFIILSFIFCCKKRLLYIFTLFL